MELSNDQAARRPVLLFRNALEAGLRISVIAVILYTVLAFFGSSHWALDLLGHLRMHVLVAGTVVAFATAWMLRCEWVIILLVFLGVNLLIIRPWGMLPLTMSPASQSDMRVLSWNTLWSNPDDNEIADRIQEMDADVVVLLEYTPQFADSLSRLRATHPYACEMPRSRSAFGVAVFSKWHCDFEPHQIAPGNIPCINATFTDSRFDGLQLWAAHFFPPIGAGWEQRSCQFEDLTALIQSTSAEDRIVCGDFNDTPWSRTLRQFLDRNGLVDSRCGIGYQASWPARLGRLGIPIDHVFVSPSITIIDRQVHFVDRCTDHGAVVVEIGLPNRDGRGDR